MRRARIRLRLEFHSLCLLLEFTELLTSLQGRLHRSDRTRSHTARRFTSHLRVQLWWLQLTTTIQLRYDGRSTAYQRSLRSQ